MRGWTPVHRESRRIPASLAKPLGEMEFLLCEWANRDFPFLWRRLGVFLVDMGHAKGKDNVKTRKARRKKNDRLEAAQKSVKKAS